MAHLVWFWGGSSYTQPLPEIEQGEKFTSIHAACSEWVNRVQTGMSHTGLTCPLWGDGVPYDGACMWVKRSDGVCLYYERQDVENYAHDIFDVITGESW